MSNNSRIRTWLNKAATVFSSGYAPAHNHELHQGEVKAMMQKYARPPFLDGIPIIKTEQLIEHFATSINKGKQVLTLSYEDFDRIVMPAIIQMIKQYSVLPSSNDHHHREIAGGIRHGLEVAAIAAKVIQGNYNAIDATPSKRRPIETRYQVGAYLAGLFHDIAKPTTDVSVRTQDGTTWNSRVQTLEDWVNQMKCERVFITWQAQRHNKHREPYVGLLTSLIPIDTKAWLTEHSDQVWMAMENALSTKGNNIAIADAVRKADQQSVKNYLTSYSYEPDAGAGIPVEKYLLEAITSLVDDGTWTVNNRASRIIIADGHLFIHWEPACKEIREVLNERQIPGVPRDPYALASILLDRNIAIPYNVDSTSKTLWPVTMEVASVRTCRYSLCIETPETIYGDAPIPKSISVTIGEPTEGQDTAAHSEAKNTAVTTKSNDTKHNPEEQVAASSMDVAGAQHEVPNAEKIIQLQNNTDQINTPVNEKQEIKHMPTRYGRLGQWLEELRKQKEEIQKQYLGGTRETAYFALRSYQETLENNDLAYVELLEGATNSEAIIRSDNGLKSSEQILLNGQRDVCISLNKELSGLLPILPIPEQPTQTPVVSQLEEAEKKESMDHVVKETSDSVTEQPVASKQDNQEGPEVITYEQTSSSRHSKRKRELAEKREKTKDAVDAVVEQLAEKNNTGQNVVVYKKQEIDDLLAPFDLTIEDVIKTRIRANPLTFSRVTGSVRVIFPVE